METWLATGSLPATTFIRSADASSMADGSAEEWRTLAEINAQIAQPTAEERAEMKAAEVEPHWLFVDANGVTLGPSPHAHMVHWWQTGALHEDTYIRTADSDGNALGEWRALKWVSYPVPINERCATIAKASTAVQSEGAGTAPVQEATSDSARDPRAEDDAADVQHSEGAASPAPTEKKKATIRLLPGGDTLRADDATTDESHGTGALRPQQLLSLTKGEVVGPEHLATWKAREKVVTPRNGDAERAFEDGTEERAEEHAREKVEGAAPRQSAVAQRWSTLRGSLTGSASAAKRGSRMHSLFVSSRLAASARSERRRAPSKPSMRSSSRAVYDDQFRAAMDASHSVMRDARSRTSAIAEEVEEEEEQESSQVQTRVQETQRAESARGGAFAADGADATAPRAADRVEADAEYASAPEQSERHDAVVDAGAADTITHGGGFTRGVLGSILPPGIKGGDIDRLMRRFGTPIDRDRAAEKELRWVDAQKRRWRRGVQKRALAKREKEARAAAGEWTPFHDLGRNGECTTFFVNSRTRERRAKPPPHAPLSFLDGGGDIELKSLRRGGDPSKAHRPTPSVGGTPGQEATHGTLEYVMDIEGFARLQQYLENQRMKIAIVTTLVIIVYFMYMRVTRSLLEIFSTVSINGKRYLAKALNLEAESNEHIGLKIAAAFFVVGFTVTMPIIGFGALTWMHRTGRGNDPRWRTAIGFLCDGYKREYFWWEAVVLLRKLTILLVAEIIAPDDGFLQGECMLFIYRYISCEHYLEVLTI